MWMPSWTIRIVWPGIEPEFRIGLVDQVPRQVVRADRIRPARGQPARAVGGDPAGGFERVGISPQRARPEPDQHHVARPDLDAARRALQIGRADRVHARDVEQHAAAHDRRHGVDPERREPGRRLHARRHLDATVHDARRRPGGRSRRCACPSARPCRPSPTRRCARSAAPRSWRRCSVRDHPGLVRRVARRARVARLLEVVDASGEQLLDHSTARISRPCVSGSIASAQIAST